MGRFCFTWDPLLKSDSKFQTQCKPTKMKKIVKVADSSPKLRNILVIESGKAKNTKQSGKTERIEVTSIPKTYAPVFLKSIPQ